ncbi:MAG TPA: hypothetical protein VGO03_00010 [Acidimicrobiia bacterium]|jgi:hypothetical protein
MPVFPAWSRARTPLLVGCVLAACWAAAGCSTPTVVGAGYQTGRHRVVELLNQEGSALPAGSGFKAVTLANTDREVCRKKFLGYSLPGPVGREAEVTQIVTLANGTDPNAMLPRIEALWRQHGYQVDLAGLRDPKFPKIRAHTGDYTLVATSFSHTPGFSNAPRVTLYAVGACMRG